MSSNLRKKNGPSLKSFMGPYTLPIRSMKNFFVYFLVGKPSCSTQNPLSLSCLTSQLRCFMASDHDKWLSAHVSMRAHTIFARNKTGPNFKWKSFFFSTRKTTLLQDNLKLSKKYTKTQDHTKFQSRTHETTWSKKDDQFISRFLFRFGVRGIFLFKFKFHLLFFILKDWNGGPYHRTISWWTWWRKTCHRRGFWRGRLCWSPRWLSIGRFYSWFIFLDAIFS